MPLLTNSHTHTQADFLASAQFAINVINTNADYYSKTRNQSDFSKVFDDIRRGKLAEFAVYRSLGMECSEPDLTVTKNNKSFDADLVARNGRWKIHVKSCQADSLFPLSWVFQPNDKVTQEPSGSDLLALVKMYETHALWGWMYATQAVEYYASPQKKSLNKRVLYAEHLAVLSENQLRGKPRETSQSISL